MILTKFQTFTDRTNIVCWALENIFIFINVYLKLIMILKVYLLDKQTLFIRIKCTIVLI